MKDYFDDYLVPFELVKPILKILEEGSLYHKLNMTKEDVAYLNLRQDIKC